MFDHAAVFGFKSLQGPRSKVQGPKTMEGHQLPPELLQWLDSWGPSLKACVEGALDHAWREVAGPFHACHQVLPKPVLVGTDCSGIEAPIHALRGLGVDHEHAWSSEIAEGPRRVLLANTRPKGQVYRSVLDSGSRANSKPCYIHLYVSGFSCKPFSLLHTNTKLLDEPEAAIFWAVAKRIASVKPASFVLENVVGIRRVWPSILTALRCNGLYHVITCEMCPTDLGEPVRRPRIYFIGVRHDVGLAGQQDLQQVIERAWAKIKEGQVKRADLGSRLLPDSHPAVAKHQDMRKKRWVKARETGYPSHKKDPKWHQLHATIKTASKNLAKNHCSADDLYLHLPRERDAWAILSHLHPKSSDLVADLSQSATRMATQCSGHLPTITPGCILASARHQRVVSPVEKLVLHGFPVHRMKLEGTTDKQVASMAGNTMHVHIVGVAMLLALGLVNWTLPCADACPVKVRQGLSSSRSKVQALRQMKHRSKCSMMMSLSARYGIPIKAKVPCKKVAKAKGRKLPAKLAHLAGTRWGLI